MKTSISLGLALFLLFVTTTPSVAQTSREELKKIMEPHYQQSVKNIAEYTCNVSLINIELEIAKLMVNLKPIPAAKYDQLVTKGTKCVGTVGNSLAYVYRAKGYAGKQDSGNALKDLAKAITVSNSEKSPIFGHHEILKERAELYIKLVERAKAEADLKESVRLAPAYSEAKDLLSKLDTKIAEAKKERALANPRTAEDFAIVGETHYYRGKYQEALAAYESSLSLSPSTAGYKGKGQALRSLSRIDNAIAEYNKGLALDPKNAELLEARGSAYRDLKNWNAALVDMTAALPGLDERRRLYLLTSRGPYIRRWGTTQPHSRITRWFWRQPTQMFR